MTNRQDAVVVTTTFYKEPLDESNAVRRTIALRTFRALKQQGLYRVLAVDGGSSSATLEEFRDLGVDVFQEEQRGMGASRRQVMRAAFDLNPRAIVWMEPEKDSYVASIPASLEPILNGGADMVIPQRISVDSYPEFQQYSERLGNLFLQEVTGHLEYLDMFFGPKLWRTDYSNYFLNYKSNPPIRPDKWDSIHLPPVHARHDGKTVMSVPVEFTYPAEQRTVEDKLGVEFQLKRIEQLAELSKATYEYWKELQQK